MRTLHLNRVIAGFTSAAMFFTSFVAAAAAAQPVDPQTATPVANGQAIDCSDAAAAAQGANNCVVQPAATPQSAQNPPPPPIPVPPLDAPGRGLHFDSTVLLGIGAVVLGAGAYFLFHKKKSGDNGGTTTTP